MDLIVYQRALLDARSRFASRAERDVAIARSQHPDSSGDSGDAAQIDESESVALSEAEQNLATLAEIDAALLRISDGTYGQCLVDGGPIEAARLDAEPWAVYCITHQRELETA